MNKEDVIRAMAEHAKVSKAAAGRALDALIATVTEAGKRGEDVRLLGFGTFAVSDRKARTGRNPKTGKTVTIPAGKVPRFRPGQTYKQAIR